MTQNFSFRSIGAALLAGTLAATWITGCGGDPNSDSSGVPPDSTTNQQTPTPPALSAKSPDIAASAATITLEPVLSAWQAGDRATAINRFMQVDWTRRPLFAPDSVLGLSETQFQAMPNSSREAKLKSLMSEAPILKRLAVAVATAGKDAAAKGDFASAKKHFAALDQCGTTLSGPDFSVLVQQFGQFMKGLADEESAKLGL